MGKNVIVGMSGGVDSSVAGFLLKQRQYAVRGVFMQNWQQDDDDDYCSIKQDSLDAIMVADMLDIDIDIINFAKEYEERVFAYFLHEYQIGRTPNPDILCNSEIKFKCFLDYALDCGADYIATGHYVRKTVEDGIHYLKKGYDKNKDQSYFLYRLNPHQIEKSLFPLGELEKSAVRQVANQLKLPTANKKDSTGICFIGERPFREFLQRYLPVEKGIMETAEGKVVGEHLGLSFYTIGQRKGLGIGGQGEPWFVAEKRIQENKLIVVQGHNHPLLLSDGLYIEDLSFTTAEKPPEGYYSAKTRYRMQDAKCELTYVSSNRIKLFFVESQWAVTPGQSAVIYDLDKCLGGGIISQAFKKNIYI